MSFTLLHYSDPHFEAVDRKIAAVAISQAHELAPQATVVSGDFSMRGRRREFREAREWLDQLPAPLLVFPGNHDVPALNNLWERFTAPFRRYRHQIHPVEEPSLALEGIGKVVSANSTTPFGWHRDWSRGFISPLQTARLSEELHSVPSDQLRILGMHHPLLAAKDKERALVSPLPLVSRMLQDCKVDLVLTGHFHQSNIGLFPEKNKECNLVVSQAPSVCSTRLKGEANGFHLLKLSPSRIEVTLWRWMGSQFSPHSSNAFAKTQGQWTKES